jgi:hypothetical protein
MLHDAGVTTAADAADQLVMLRDGAMAGGHLGDPETVGRSLYTAGAQWSSFIADPRLL